jgi:hypothetical protein
MKEAARATALLWVFTCIAYGLHAQSGFPLFNLLSESKIFAVALNLVSCALVLAFPEHRLFLVLSGLVASASLLTWHSWLGAYQPLVPFLFFGLALFSQAPVSLRQRVLLDSVLAGILFVTLHRLNGEFLSGFEWSSRGSLSVLFPGWLTNLDFFSEAPATAARAWLLLVFSPLPFLLKNHRIGWILLAFSALVSIVLYNVLFYGAFIALPLVLQSDPEFLSRWKSSRFAASPFKPLHLFLIGMAIFFLWYVFFRHEFFFYFLSIGLCSCSVLLAPRPRLASIPGLSDGWDRRRGLWMALWIAYLSLPLFWAKVPPPFGMTHFSAREVRFPPQEEVLVPLQSPTCRSQLSNFALRWGYSVEQRDGTCVLHVYRNEGRQP